MVLKTAGSMTNIYLIKSKSKQTAIEQKNFFVFVVSKKVFSGRFLLPSFFDCCLTSSNLFVVTDSESESGSHKSIRGKQGPTDGKPTRVRTVLNEKQLHTLR